MVRGLESAGEEVCFGLPGVHNLAAWKALAGSGIGYNNNYAPVTLGPDHTAYVGTLGGLVALRDMG